MEWFGWSTSFSPTLFVLFVSNPKLKSQNLVGILNGFHCDHFGSVESEWTRVSEIRFDPVCFLNTQTLSICQETNNGKCLSLFNLVYYLIFHHHVITCSVSYTTFLFQLTSPSQFETPFTTQFTSVIWHIFQVKEERCFFFLSIWNWLDRGKCV